MTPPRLEAVYFGDGAGHQWPRMARVLAHSARQQLSGWEVHVRQLHPPPVTGHAAATESHRANSQKLQAWVDLVRAAVDGDRLLLIDADTMILRPLDDVWLKPFEVAYTERVGVKLPINAGVVFLRVGPFARHFFEHWLAANMRLLRDPTEHQIWRTRYGGINQAALGSILVEPAGWGLGRLRCQEWNCEDASWTTFDPARTRIVHLKSALRRAVFGIGPSRPGLQPLVAIWRRLEREAGEAGS